MNANVSRQLELIRENYSRLLPKADELVLRFYSTLFLRHPEFKNFFDHTEMTVQREKVEKVLLYLVSNLNSPEVLSPALRQLGQQHKSLGAQPELYGIFGACLLATIEDLSGNAWSAELAEAWREAIDLVTREMLAGASNAKRLTA